MHGRFVESGRRSRPRPGFQGVKVDIEILAAVHVQEVVGFAGGPNLVRGRREVLLRGGVFVPVDDAFDPGRHEERAGFEELFFALQDARVVLDDALQAAVGLADQNRGTARGQFLPQSGQVPLDADPHGQEGNQGNQQQQQDEELEADAHRTSGMTA